MHHNCNDVLGNVVTLINLMAMQVPVYSLKTTLLCNMVMLLLPTYLATCIILLQDQIMHSQYSYVCLYFWVLRLNCTSSSCTELNTVGNEVLVSNVTRVTLPYGDV